MLSQRQTWKHIVNKDATPGQILSFLDAYLKSDHYARSPLRARLDFNKFYRLIEESLEDEDCFHLVCDYVHYRLLFYGALLED